MNERKMKALVYRGPRDISIEKIDISEINDEEILLKIKYAGVCGTDIRIFKGTKRIPEYTVIGHEFSGEIVKVGKKVSQQFEKGEGVTVYPMIPCGKCYCCKTNRKNICLNRKTIGYEIDGGFAEYVKIPKEAIQNGNVIKLPKSIDFIEAALSEPVTAAYHGIKRSGVREGQKIAIFGAGYIGISHVQLVNLFNPEKIIVVEPNEEKRELASKFGAKVLIDPFENDVEKQILKKTNNEGVDIAIVDVGIPNVIEQALLCVKKGGTLLVFAGCPEGSKITIDPNWIHYREINLTGSSAATPEEQKEVLDMIAFKKLNVKPLLTEILPLEKWKEAFEMKENYIGFKTLIKF